ncbi:bile acid:sodium symporter [Microbacterium sp. TNHR37B]|uniref:bile acid:sodium symporter n=1 Tax=Microbacterium sp. TNHR37B TaxID=1775956 RepID=UPI0007B2F2C2|nr:arsenic resistance protein [Microbacterium sp. TNHR37B]KZE90889.1 hypothetical protein AVP41_00410 [Microbacterium sp. TNHR37B]
MQRHQLALYLGAMMAGAAVGLLVPASAFPFPALVTPALMMLLIATFLSVPLARLAEAGRDVRFLAAVLVLNFAVAPGVVFILSRFVADDAALLVGVLLVLLTPCVDYVIVFTRMAGGAADRLLAATPLLMILQFLLLPLWLVLFAGADTMVGIDAGPFAEAFMLFIAVPLGLAAAAQWAAARWRPARTLVRSADTAMVPIMTLTLVIVVAAQVPRLGSDAAALVRVIPLFVVFLGVMTALGVLTARVFRQQAVPARAVVFSGVTRNSLVVLPLALALPEGLAVAGSVVVTQTLVELVGMVVWVRLVPSLLPAQGIEGTSVAPGVAG